MLSPATCHRPLPAQIPGEGRLVPLTHLRIPDWDEPQVPGLHGWGSEAGHGWTDGQTRDRAACALLAPGVRFQQSRAGVRQS